MKKYINGNLPHLLYKNWPNLVRVVLGLSYKSRGFLKYYRHFNQQINRYVNSSKSKNRRMTSYRSRLSRLQQAIHSQIPIASELPIIYHTIPRFRPSTII
ncbi:MAG: hypothetical protein GQ532_16515 [Methylomarinum sp.]|nr:hypothetical protein [Methylomarinum sp.]